MPPRSDVPTSTASPAPRRKAPAAEPAGGSALSRLLDIFDLFSANATVIHIDQVTEHVQMSRSTCYRYLQELSERGFLVPRGKGSYGLGPRVIELERLLQSSDPLLNAGMKVMAGMADLCENRTLLLCALFKDRVLCAHQVGSDHIRHGDQLMPIYRGRGSAFPLFQGAGSLVILAYLAPHRIRALYLSRQEEIAAAGLGDSWPVFRRFLAEIRRQGYARTVGRINDRVVALAVPVMRHEGHVMASLLLLLPNLPAEHALLDTLVARLQGEAARITELEHHNAAGLGGD